MKECALVLAGVSAFLCSSLAFAGSLPSKVDSHLQGVLARAATTEFVDVYAVLGDRLTYNEVMDQAYGLKRKARQREVVRMLKNHSAATRMDVEAFLRRGEAEGTVRNVTIIWAINTVSFSATQAVIAELAQGFSSVEKIFFDPKHPVDQLMDDNGISRLNEDQGLQVNPILAPQIGLTLINAPAVWAEGDSGQGVLVANIDTGCDWDHTDLVKNIWNNLGEDANGNGATIVWNGSSWVFDAGDVNGIDNDGNGLVDDLIGWDYVGNDKDPSGGASHGTSTSGLVAGDGTAGTQTGVAPRAKLMILEPNGESSVWTAMQYAIDKGADITTSSLSYKWYFSPQPNYPMWREMTDMELAAGLVHTNSTSNDGGLFGSAPIPYNISAPGNCPPAWLHPDQTLIGGLSSVTGCGNVEATTDIISTSSPYGPSAWEDIQSVHPTYPFSMPIEYQDYPYETTPAQGLLKPDVSAPGNGTTSTREGGGYSTFSGTSGATPHVAGTAALILGANPDLEPADVARILQETAVEKGAAGKDIRYGAGRIDAYAAYLAAVSTGGGIPCSDVFFFNAKCNANGAAQAMVKISGDYTGETVTFELDGNPQVVSLLSNGTNSIGKMQVGAAGIGAHTVELVDPAGCYAAVNFNCQVDALPDPEWDALWAEYEVMEKTQSDSPAVTRILGNYPNPFNPSTTISYSLGEPAWVSLKIFNTLGQEVATLVNGFEQAGSRTTVWNGTNSFGSVAASGIYMVRLVVGQHVSTQRILFMK